MISGKRRFVDAHPHTWRIGFLMWVAFASQSATHAGQAPEKSDAARPHNESQQPAVSISEVRRLVDQLAADSRRARVLAERRLMELGPSILDALPAPDVIESPQVRTTLTRIRSSLEQQAATQSLQPAVVRFAKPMSLAETFQQLEQRTGNRIDFTAIPPSTLLSNQQTTAKRQTFWEVISAIERRHNVRCELGSAGQLIAVPGQGEWRQVHPRSAFRVRLVSCRERRLKTASRESKVRVKLWIDAEPRLRPLFATLNGESITLAEANANEEPRHRFPSLLPAAAQIEYPMAISRPRMTIEQDFQVNPSEFPNSYSLSGSIDVEVAARLQEFRFRSTDRQKLIRRSGVSVRLTEWSATEQVIQITIRVGYDNNGPAFESHRTWVFHNAAALETHPGQRVSPAAPPETIRQDGGQVELQYRFQVGKSLTEESEFVYEAPSFLSKMSVPIDFPRITPDRDGAPTAPD